MNIVITGSLGNIGRPLAEILIRNGHGVTVISSSPQRRAAIEALGAKAAIGTMEDPAFLAHAFAGADGVYVMATVSQSNFFDPDIDLVSKMTRIGENYKYAIETASVKKVVQLSSAGAHTDVGNGNLAFHYNIEQILKQLPEDVGLKVLRPGGFFTNLLRSAGTAREQGVLVSNYGGDAKEPWVSPRDIAVTVAEELETPFTGRTVRYVASEEVSPNQIAKVLGEAVGRPDLHYRVITDRQLLDQLLSVGMNAGVARGLVEMQTAQGNGSLFADYNRHKPKLGRVKLADFAAEFATVYHQ